MLEDLCPRRGRSKALLKEFSVGRGTEMALGEEAGKGGNVEAERSGKEGARGLHAMREAQKEDSATIKAGGPLHPPVRKAWKGAGKGEKEKGGRGAPGFEKREDRQVAGFRGVALEGEKA